MSRNLATGVELLLTATAAVVALLGAGCVAFFPEPPLVVSESVPGLRPVYLDSAAARTIVERDLDSGFGLSERSAVNDLQSIAVLVLRGLIIETASDTSAPFPRFDRRFYSVPGGTGARATAPDTVVANNQDDLVTFALDASGALTEVRRVRGGAALPPPYPVEPSSFFTGSADFSSANENYDGSIYFECYDPALGFLGGWAMTQLDAPECLTR